jgi:hypothetical protein
VFGSRRLPSLYLERSNVETTVLRIFNSMSIYAVLALAVVGGGVLWEAPAVAHSVEHRCNSDIAFTQRSPLLLSQLWSAWVQHCFSAAGAQVPA